MPTLGPEVYEEDLLWAQGMVRAQNPGSGLNLFLIQGFGSWATGCPDPWADPKSRSTLGFYNLHHRRTRVQHLGVLLFESSRGSLQLQRDRCQGSNIEVLY